jgi:hypothetical protein
MNMISAPFALRDLMVVVSLHTAVDPSMDEWSRYATLLTNALAKVQGEVSLIRNFVVTDGGGPNAKQRAILRDVFGGRPNKISVVTNSLGNPIKRGLATAVSWINPSFLAVPVESWRQALAHIDIEGDVSRVLDELNQLQTKIAPIKSLEQLVALYRASR